MLLSVWLVLLGIRCALAQVEASEGGGPDLSPPTSELPEPLSSSSQAIVNPIPSQESTTEALEGSSSEIIVNPISSQESTTQSLAGPSIITSTFSPFPAPSSEPAIPDVYPESSPQNPPPVESPWLVPDFADAWAEAYKKAKLKVCSQIHITIFRTVASHRNVVSVAHSLAV